MTSSKSTDLSLILRVRNSDQAAWEQFVQIYGAMTYEWARRAGLQPDDARDMSQNVFLTVAEKIDQWQRGGFRGWLWSIFRSKLMDHFRALKSNPQGVGGSTANVQIHQVPDQPPAEDSDEGRRDIQGLRERALEIVREKIDDQHWQAFFRTVIKSDTPANVAADLGVSVWVVYKAKSRVTRRITKEFEGLDFIKDWKDALEN